MNGFEKFIHSLQYEVTRPKVFGWYHLMCIAIVIALVSLVFVFRKKISKRFINILLLTVGCTLLVSEGLKQLIHSLDVVDGVATWEYSWRNFPFQFCSIPMYLMTIAGILRKGKVYDTILCFLATFGLFGGCAVMVYPSTVLSAHVFLSIHTMMWHGSMTVVGFLLLATKSVKLNFKSVLYACIVFGISIVLAEIMNIIWHYVGTEKTFNMFYISPYYECDIPVLSAIKDNAPYFVFLLCYVIGFILIAFIIMGIAIGIDKLYTAIQKKKTARGTKN